jgi:phosphatidylserine/phosphatidylglycerophosphate/cardiolipin synthase-like enzyme
MEDEVPTGDQRFLKYPTRRAFIEDRVQVRVQTHGLALNNPKIAVYLHNAARPSSEYALIVGSDQGEMQTLQNRHLPASHRAITQQGNISTVSTAQGLNSIYLEVDVNKSRSFIATTLVLPPLDPDDTDESPVVTYYARVEIIDAHKTYLAYTPTIEAVRWWAAPSKNLRVVRTRPTAAPTPLIDGENYFGEVDQLLRAAQAGDHVYLASWSFNPFTMVDGGHNAVRNGEAAGDLATGLQNTLAAAIAEAVDNGATVHILLDSHNHFFGRRYIQHLKGDNFFGPHENRVEVRESVHHKVLKIGVGKFSMKELIGSYHEKYVCLVGSQHVALIGGIDPEPDRMNPQGHAWRHWGRHYRQLLKKHFYQHVNDHKLVDDSYSNGPLGPWHDVAIKVVGPRAIHDLCEDFIRRWNAAEGDGNALNAPNPVPPPTPGERYIQFVKTDEFKEAYQGIPASKHHGTYEATLQAVREARHFIYMENQYMRDADLAAAIADAMRANTRLQVILVIPFITEEALRAGNQQFKNRTIFWAMRKPGKKAGKIQERANVHGDYLQAQFVAKVREVDAARVGLYALARNVGDVVSGKPEQIYPHAKTMVVDDTWAYIGSANANGRSFKLDGESGYIVHDRAIVTAYRKSLWQEHMHTPAPDTRDIRAFRTFWDAHCVKGETDPSTIAPGLLAATSAVELQNPPQGQRYNGPGSSVVNLHDYL